MVMSPLLEVRFPSAVISCAASISTSLLPATFCIVTLPLLELRTALPVSAVTSPLVAILPLAFAITLLNAFTMLLVVMLPPAFNSTFALMEVTSLLALISPLALAVTLLRALVLPLVVILPPAYRVMSPLLEVRFPSAVISYAASISTAFLAVTLPMVTTEPFLELMLILSDAFKSAPLAVVISPSALTVILPLCASLYLEVLMAELMVILPVFAW